MRTDLWRSINTRPLNTFKESEDHCPHLEYLGRRVLIRDLPNADVRIKSPIAFKFYEDMTADYPIKDRATSELGAGREKDWRALDYLLDS